MHQNLIKKLIYFILAVIFIGLMIFAKNYYDSNQLNVEPEGGQFSIHFPGPPKRIHSEDIFAYAYHTKNREFTYLAAYWDVAKDAIEKKSKIQLIGSIASKHMETYPIVLKDVNSLFAGEIARDLWLKDKNNNAMRAKIILKKNYRMIMIVVFTKNTDDLNNPSVNAYLDTLKLQ